MGWLFLFLLGFTTTVVTTNHEGLGTRNEKKHAYDLNSWYRLARLYANETRSVNCYVCSYMPVSSTHPSVWATPLNQRASECVMNKIYGVDKSVITLIHRNGSSTTLTPCFETHPLHYTTTAQLLTPYVRMKPKLKFPKCYVGTGTIPVGQIPEERCAITEAMYLDQCPWRSRCYGGRGVPSGTKPMEGIYWICGNAAYTYLPSGWGGVCAPAILSDHTFVISTINVSHTNRAKRAINPIKQHDPIWGTDVPNDHKLWTEGSKVLMSLFPWVGVGKTLLRVETLNYRLEMYINASLTIEERQNKEITAIRQMVLQNRLVLDLQTAAAGGVCVLINQTCCTYISDDVNSDDMNDSMQRLRDLQKVMAEDHAQESDSWLNWLWSGGLTQMLIKGFFLLTCVLFLVCLVMACVVPCVKAVLTKFVSNAFVVQYTLMTQATKDNCHVRMKPAHMDSYEDLDTPDPDDYDDMNKPDEDDKDDVNNYMNDLAHGRDYGYDDVGCDEDDEV